MTIDEYKERFGLCKRTKTTEKSYSDTMSRYAKNNGMDQQILQAGKTTRIQKGQVDKRKGKKVRLQEILDKRKRKRKRNK